jgi:hypothetical protein
MQRSRNSGAIPIASVVWLSVAAAAGCAAPGPAVRLVPVGAHLTWMSGRPALTKEAGGVKVVAAFDHQEGDRLALHVMIANEGTETWDANPRDMSYSACTTEGPTSCAQARYVVDPEEILASAELEQSRHEANASGAAALTGALVFLAAFADVATVVSGRATPTTGLATAGALALNESARDSTEREGARVAAVAQRWSAELLRRTTLVPGGYIDGSVYLPIDLDAGYLWFHVRAGGQVLSFPFLQTVTRPLTGAETPADFETRAGGVSEGGRG